MQGNAVCKNLLKTSLANTFTEMDKITWIKRKLMLEKMATTKVLKVWIHNPRLSPTST
ncbi:hypothetical protein BN938_2937 [Mucinivorans hirudinis]|uniref:Uncharacterized protein n=1 Tax=Mucinivorans hirudinis TaxID=1433126 RepID=A0A060RBN4_9BACT|nr:hypothetical protein BN938_2937 [Mucinivorans hirudinis]